MRICTYTHMIMTLIWGMEKPLFSRLCPSEIEKQRLWLCAWYAPKHVKNLASSSQNKLYYTYM